MSQISSSAPVAVARPARISSFAPLAAGVPAALLLALALGARHETYDPAAPSASLFSLSPSSPEAPIDSAAPVTTPVAAPVVVAPQTKGELQAMAARGEWPRVQTALAVAGVSWSAPLVALPSVRGRAPMSGQVSRVSVRVGQSVAVNDTILQLSGGPSSRVSRAGSRVERRQSAAEQQQVAAANRQMQLQQKMVAAQGQLATAQERVARAQKRVEEARDVVARLRRGEAVPAPARAMKPRVARRETVRNPKRDAALQAARELESQAKSAQAEAAKAKHQVEILGARLGAAHNAVQAAQAALATAQKRFDAKEIKAADLDAARAAVEEAGANEKSVAADLASARGAVASSEARADAAQSKAKNAAKEAGSMPSLRDMTVFGDDNSAPATDSSAETAGGMSVIDAVRLARSAVNESEAAVAEARRIKKRVDLYAGQVTKTRSDISASSKNLESAQNAVLDQTIQVNLASVRAPASGVVESVAGVAQSVGAGDTIVTIGRPASLRATWTDATKAWRALKLSQTVPVEISAPDGSRRGAIARISEITARPDGGATIEAFIHNPRVGAARAWQSGWQARALLDAKAVATTRVPQNALVGAGLNAGALMRVAVLAPVAGETVVQLQWRRVRLQKRETTGAAANQWTVSGVRVGERVALNAGVLPAQSTKLRLVG